VGGLSLFSIGKFLAFVDVLGGRSAMLALKIRHIVDIETSIIMQREYAA